MVVTTVKSILDIVNERGVIIDPVFVPRNLEEYEQHLNNRMDTEAGYIEVRYQTHPYKLDFTEFAVLPTFTVAAIEELNGNKPFYTLRAFIFSELEEGMFMVDFDYVDINKDGECKSYILDKVTVYDNRDNKTFKSEFSLNGRAEEYGVLMYDTVGEILEATAFIVNTRDDEHTDTDLNAGINI